MTQETQTPTEIVNAEALPPEVMNSLKGLVAEFVLGANGTGSQLSQTTTLRVNQRGYMISNDRALLSYAYVEHGIIQTLIDQPVDDAFRTGFEIKSSELDANDIDELQQYIERHHVVTNIKQGFKWARLYGGGSLLILTDQPANQPFNIEKVREDSPLEFRATDMWELYSDFVPTPGTMDYNDVGGTLASRDYRYNGIAVAASRVMPILGKQAPSFIRPRMRGWGMSEVERLVRSLNQYMKNQDVIFELMDEAKVDVYKIEGFNSALLNATGTQKITERTQLSNMLKNFQNAIVMDVKDEYEQKQQPFTGLAEMVVQNRQGIAADLKMPVTKLFGISAAGFNSGEDDIENYNSMLEGEVRAKAKYLVVDVLRICCKKLFGFVPEDLSITFNPLRELSASEQEEVKDKRLERVIKLYDKGLMTPLEAKQAINKDALVPVEIDESEDALPPPGQTTITADGDPTDGA